MTVSCGNISISQFSVGQVEDIIHSIGANVQPLCHDKQILVIKIQKYFLESK